MPRYVSRSRVEFDAQLEETDDLHVQPPKPKASKFPQQSPDDETGALDVDGLIFNGTRQERVFVTESLAEFYYDQWFRQIVYKVKGGKEANVYCCRAETAVREATGCELIAAKVFRPRMFRAMHNDWFYKQGRTSRDPEGKAVYRGRSVNLIERDSKTAQKVNIESWCWWEHDTLSRLHAAGVTVPRPLAQGATAILMEYLGDETGAAPVLHSVAFDRGEATRVFQQLLKDVEVSLLKCERVHADLSAHNVLWWQDRAVIIDWPQAVPAREHPDAKQLLQRDLTRLCEYFERQGIAFRARYAATEGAQLTESLWRRFTRGEG
jgi:RIO kinase 1